MTQPGGADGPGEESQAHGTERRDTHHSDTEHSDTEDSDTEHSDTERSDYGIRAETYLRLLAETELRRALACPRSPAERIPPAAVRWAANAVGAVSGTADLAARSLAPAAARAGQGALRFLAPPARQAEQALPAPVRRAGAALVPPGQAGRRGAGAAGQAGRARGGPGGLAGPHRGRPAGRPRGEPAGRRARRDRPDASGQPGARAQHLGRAGCRPGAQRGDGEVGHAELRPGAGGARAPRRVLLAALGHDPRGGHGGAGRADRGGRHRCAGRPGRGGRRPGPHARTGAGAGARRRARDDGELADRAVAAARERRPGLG